MLWRLLRISPGTPAVVCCMGTPGHNRLVPTGSLACSGPRSRFWSDTRSLKTWSCPSSRCWSNTFTLKTCSGPRSRFWSNTFTGERPGQLVPRKGLCVWTRVSGEALRSAWAQTVPRPSFHTLTQRAAAKVGTGFFNHHTYARCLAGARQVLAQVLA